MKKTARKLGPARPRGSLDYSVRKQRSALSEYGPMVFGGVMLVMAFAFAGHYMGQNAIAHNAEPGETLEPRRGTLFKYHRQGIAASRGHQL